MNKRHLGFWVPIKPKSILFEAICLACSSFAIEFLMLTIFQGVVNDPFAYLQTLKAVSERLCCQSSYDVLHDNQESLHCHEPSPVKYLFSFIEFITFY